jgi:hypothetical protein
MLGRMIMYAMVHQSVVVTLLTMYDTIQ